MRHTREKGGVMGVAKCKHEWEYLDAYGDWYEGQYTRKCKKCGLVEDVEYEGDWEWKRTWYEKEREGSG